VKVGAPTAPQSCSQVVVAAKPAQQGPSCDPESWSALESQPFPTLGIGSTLTSPNAQYSSSELETTESFPELESFRIPELCRIPAALMLLQLGWVQ